MKRTTALLLALALAALATARQAEAQARFGVNVSWGDDTDVGLGARLGFGLGEVTRRHRIEGQATFDFFFPDGGDVWELTGNGIYRLTPSGTVAPYLGAGLGYAHYGSSYVFNAASRSRLVRPVFNVAQLAGSGSDSNFFLNLLGGLRFKPAGNIQPFAEARLEVGSGSQLVLTGGVFFGRK